MSHGIFRLGVVCPRAHDATSLYRAMGPLIAMDREGKGLVLVQPSMGPEGLGLGWNFLLQVDALFVQRPWLKEHVQLVVNAKMMKIPVWIDWDDDYATVHPSNPGYRQYLGCEENLDRLAKLADVISVSTEEIARRRSKRTKTREKFRVIPNALHFPMQDTPGRTRRVSWRGGASHEHDLLWALPKLAELARMPEFSRWDWCFLGDVPWQVEQLMPHDRLVADFGAEPYLYMEAMQKLQPWVHIVPLADTPFNPAKSNLAWIEASSCGAVVLAPDWKEWKQPGVINYSNRDDFAVKLITVMKSFAQDEVHPKALESRAFIQSNLTLKTINALRWEVIEVLWEARAKVL